MRTLIITATILAPAAASAGGYLIPNSDPRALAVAQAAVANETGASAVTLNTAALAGQEGLDIAIAGEILNNRTEWSDPGLGVLVRGHHAARPGDLLRRQAAARPGLGHRHWLRCARRRRAQVADG